MHKVPDVFSRETVCFPGNDPVSRLWSHVTDQIRAWERALEPPKHFQGMLSTEFTAEQYAQARRRVGTYNRSVARAIQADDEKALVSAIQELEGGSEGFTENRRTWPSICSFLKRILIPSVSRSASSHAPNGALPIMGTQLPALPRSVLMTLSTETAPPPMTSTLPCSVKCRWVTGISKDAPSARAK